MINLQANKYQFLSLQPLRSSADFNHSRKNQTSQSDFSKLLDNPSNRVFVNKNLMTFAGKTVSVFDSAIENIKVTRGDKEAKEVLVNILTEMNKTFDFVEKYNSSASDIKTFGYGMGPKEKAFADKVSEKYYQKTGHSFYPGKFMPEKLENIISEVGYNVEEMTQTQFQQLEKAYDNFTRKEFLKSSTIQLLNHNKELPEFKPFINNIERIVADFENRINLLGLSPETRLIVDSINKDLGVKVDMPDLPQVAQLLSDQLRLYKHPEINYDLPERITLNNFNNFATLEQKNAVACFYYPCEENFNDEMSLLYTKINGCLDTTKIDFNPFVLFGQLDDNNQLKSSELTNFCDDLRHELGHFWRFKNIGIDNYLQEKVNDLMLDEEDQKIVMQFIKSAEKNESDWPEIKDIDTSTIIDYYQAVQRSENKKQQFDALFLSDLKPVIEKLERIVEAQDVIISEFPVEVHEHAATSIEEMIAFAVQYIPYKQYSEKSEAFFAKHGMPEMKDRCLIADREKYLNQQPEVKSEPVAETKKGLFSGIRKFFS